MHMNTPTHPHVHTHKYTHACIYIEIHAHTYNGLLLVSVIQIYSQSFGRPKDTVEDTSEARLKPKPCG